MKVTMLINRVEKTLMPINLYEEHPNLTNLNNLGRVLKVEI